MTSAKERVRYIFVKERYGREEVGLDLDVMTIERARLGLEGRSPRRDPRCRSDAATSPCSTQGCPASFDTCPDQPGQDSTHNDMDYSYDECLDTFTKEQGQRMFTLFDQLRAGE